MTWSKLADRFNQPDFPLIIAGPILRKVTSTSVTVWIALKEPADVTLMLYAGDAEAFTEVFSGEGKSVRVGKNLHLVVVTARPKAGQSNLTAGTVYSYDLSFKTANGNPKNLVEAVGGSGKAAYAYGSRRLPSFSLPPDDLEAVRLFQGSCRKPNSRGPDALAILDEKIEGSVDSQTGRPHQLLLTGDQIYADEVADVLLLMLTEAASVLVDDNELLPFPDGSEASADMLPPTTREDAILKAAEMTTVDSRSHLMSFGEYVCMYLFVWSDVLWPSDLPEFTDLMALEGIKNNSTATLRLAKLLGEVQGQRDGVLTLKRDVLKVRRALANVPTAMILDDHEITDDFNLNRAFCNQVYGSVLGRRIVQNGLLAYSLCQHWGNAPEQFESNPSLVGADPAGVEVLHLLNTSTKYTDIADNPFLKTALGLHTPDKLAAQLPAYAVYHDRGARSQTADGAWLDSQSLLFNYTIEANAYQIIVTDTRTWRSFPNLGDPMLPSNTSPPDLIAQNELVFQIGGTPPLRNRLLLVVVTTNMPAASTIRQGERDLPLLVGLGGGESLWYEDFYDSWRLTSVNYARALAEIARSKFEPDANNVHAGGLVLLSGDVHSSSASRLAYSASAQAGDAAGAPTKAELTIAQLVGSALHNQNKDTLGQHDKGYAYVPPVIKYDKDFAKILAQPIMLSEDFVGWNPVTTSNGSKVGIYYVFYFDVLTQAWKSKGHDLAFKSEDCTYTLREESVRLLSKQKITNITKAPDYRIRLDYLPVKKSDRDNYQPLGLAPGTLLKRAAEKARAYADYVMAAGSAREMVGKHNIGEITFVRDANPLTGPDLLARYTVHWLQGTKLHFTSYDVSLDVLDPDYAQRPYPT